jgi:hypothetical protein
MTTMHTVVHGGDRLAVMILTDEDLIWMPDEEMVCTGQDRPDTSLRPTSTSTTIKSKMLNNGQDRLTRLRQCHTPHRRRCEVVLEGG